MHPGARITISLIMTLPFQHEWQKKKYPRCKWSNVRLDAQIFANPLCSFCNHTEIITAILSGLSLLGNIDRKWLQHKSNIFPGLRWVPNRDPDSDADTDAQMKMVREACRLLRASENLAGTADGKPGVFLEAERPQRDLIRLDLTIIIVDRFNDYNN